MIASAAILKNKLRMLVERPVKSTAKPAREFSRPPRFLHEPLRWQRMTLLLLGWLLPQLLLHGSVLTGARLALPLDCLALPDFYLPQTAEYSQVVPGDPVLTDLVLYYPFTRQFAAREIREGRLPHWNPHNFAVCCSYIRCSRLLSGST